MKEDDKLTDAIIDLGLGMKELRDEMKAMRKDMNHGFGELNNGFIELNNRVERLEKQQAKTNIILAEHSRAILKLAEGQDKHSHSINGLRSDFIGLRSDINGLRSDFNRYASSNDKLISNHETRIVRLEDKTPGGTYVAREPASEYKKSRNKRDPSYGGKKRK